MRSLMKLTYKERIKSSGVIKISASPFTVTTCNDAK